MLRLIRPSMLDRPRRIVVCAWHVHLGLRVVLATLLTVSTFGVAEPTLTRTMQGQG